MTEQDKKVRCSSIGRESIVFFFCYELPPYQPKLELEFTVPKRKTIGDGRRQTTNQTSNHCRTFKVLLYSTIALSSITSRNDGSRRVHGYCAMANHRKHSEKNPLLLECDQRYLLVSHKNILTFSSTATFFYCFPL